ncbi:MAG: hypothetical protein RBQ99_04915 [Trichlorobacter sp.]|jgi:predicted PurR-regulated permease PerM|nr:hypothetical protein [Trichlorobacter sp.]
MQTKNSDLMQDKLQKQAVMVSYLLALLAVPLVLEFHLLPSVFSGLAVYVLTIRLSTRFLSKMDSSARAVSLVLIATTIVTTLTLVAFVLWSALGMGQGMSALFAKSAEVLDSIRRTLPPFMAAMLPDNLHELREEVVLLLHEHGKNLSSVGASGARTFIYILFGMIIGGLLVMNHIDHHKPRRPLAAALHGRCQNLAGAFDRIVIAQVKISAFNTFLTSIYLLLVLPIFGVRLPLVSVLIPLTFITGLLPIVGNILSNTAIVLISFSVSATVAVSSLLFLVMIHKLEYLANAKIVGGEVQAKTWELLCAMLLMEAVFGIPGIVAAPVVYAWLKVELKLQNLI